MHAAVNTVCFVYATGQGFSGQREASLQIINNINKTKWSSVCIRIPALERKCALPFALIAYVLKLGLCWVQCLFYIWYKIDIIHLNLGQTKWSLHRDTISLRLLKYGRGNRQLIVSLHGSNFMEWCAESKLSEHFMKILSKAKLITVLGNRQLRKLISIGIQPNNICIVPNTCTVSGISTGEVISKHNNSNPIHILHLSSLIDTKGFPSYLEALLLLSKDSGPRIEATLCGPLTLSPFASRFSSNQMAEQWIIDTLAAINRSSRVKAVWIPGATGTDKWELYKRTHIFVLPTSYKVEAQPIVLLEAMAHGCALVTTRVGEIDAIVSSMEAIFLDSTDATTVASAIDKLTIDEVLRKELAMAGFSRFKKEFTLNSYVNRWELLLKECAC